MEPEGLFVSTRIRRRSLSRAWWLQSTFPNPFSKIYFNIIVTFTHRSAEWSVFCMGRNFRVLPRPARGPFGSTEPEPDVYLLICYPSPTEARPPFIPARIKSDVFTVFPDYPVINTYFSQCINTTNSWTIIQNGVNTFAALVRIDCCGPLFFAKRELPEKPQYNVWLLSFEPDPNPKIICATTPRPLHTRRLYWNRLNCLIADFCKCVDELFDFIKKQALLPMVC
jgi:hypothetical protein